MVHFLQTDVCSFVHSRNTSFEMDNWWKELDCHCLFTIVTHLSHFLSKAHVCIEEVIVGFCPLSIISFTLTCRFANSCDIRDAVIISDCLNNFKEETSAVLQRNNTCGFGFNSNVGSQFVDEEQFNVRRCRFAEILAVVSLHFVVFKIWQYYDSLQCILYCVHYL